MNDARTDQNDNESAPLEAIVEQAIQSSRNGAVSLKDVLMAWGDRSYGPVFVVLGSVGGTPLAVVPGAAAVVGVVIALIAIQMVFGKAHPWLPEVALRQSISEEKLRQTQSRLEPFLVFIDGLVTERLTWAAGGIIRQGAALIVVCLGLLMIPFDAVPFAVAAPAWAVVLFGVAITARDGLVMLLSVAAFAGVVRFGVALIS